VARKKKGNYANTSMIKQKVDKAHKMFLQKQGNITNTEMGEAVGTTRQTIAKHRADGKWDVELEQLKQEISTNITGKIVNATVEEFSPIYKDAVENLKAFNTFIRLKLLKQNKDGDVLRNMDGTPKINDALKPKDIGILVRASGEYVRTMRLLTGESTDNVATDQQITGKIEHEHMMELPGLDRLVRKAGAGDEEAQRLLLDYTEITQTFQEAE
jgi:hypothetical protein